MLLSVEIDMKLNQLYEVKPMCLVSSNNVVINGDVAFHRGESGEFVGDFTHSISIGGNTNIKIQNCLIATKFPQKTKFKIKALWFWHMVILRKPYVYLTGVCR